MKKTYVSIIISVVAFTLLGMHFWHLIQLCRQKDDFGKNGHLVTSAPGTFDVLLAGSSHIAVIQPIWLWEDCGITSYNIFTRGDGMDRSLASLKLALDYQKPKLVVLDTDAWWREESFEESPGDFHQTFDYYPFSLHKAEVIKETVPGNTAAQRELLFDFLRYHSRIQNLKRTDFQYDYDTCLGAHLRITGYPQTEHERIAPDEVADFDANRLSVLTKAIELCQSRGIDVLLICLPFSAESSDQAYQHVVNSIAQQYHVPFYNFLDHESLIDYKTDLKDRGHLNMSGAAKLMPVLEEQILKACQLTDHRNEPEIAAWWGERQDEFRKGIVNYMNQPELITYNEGLILLSQPFVSGEVFLKNERTGILNTPGTQELLINAVHQELPEMKRAAAEGLNYLLIYNSQSGTVQEFVGQDIENILGEPKDLECVLISLRDAKTNEFIAEIRQE